MRLVFLGSPPFATPILTRLLESRHDVAALVARPDKPSGRGLSVKASPLVELARGRGVEVLQPPATREKGFAETLRALAPDVLLVASWGEILAGELLTLAPHGALNVHASLLPRHRGASPVQAAILAGDEKTGVTIQRIVLKLDEGDVLLSLETPIREEETSGDLLARLSELGGEAAVRALDELESGRALFRPQDAARATYARKIGKDAGTIDWSRSAVEITRHVRAMTPWPGARTRTEDGAEIVLLEVAPADSPAPPAPGVLVSAGGAPLVGAGDRPVEILRVKPAGKAAMDARAWLRGARLAPGSRFTA